MIIYIKNMVCDRCIKSVLALLKDLHIQHRSVFLGEVHLQEPLSDNLTKQLSELLKKEGFELIDDRKTRLIVQIKKIILESVREESEQQSNLSHIITIQLHLDYSYLSTLFSSVEGTTIEKYYIAQKIEFAKELLVYDELSLSQIADKLGYSSVQHLSNQFKKVTGLTPSHFKQIGAQKRISLDNI